MEKITTFLKDLPEFFEQLQWQMLSNFTSFPFQRMNELLEILLIALGVIILGYLHVKFKILRPFGYIFKILFQFRPKPKIMEYTRFLTKKELRSNLKPPVKDSICLNGKDLFLPEISVFMHFIIIALTGGGKSSVVTIPTILQGVNLSSALILDVAGDILAKTGTYKSETHNIKVFNLTEPKKSFCYNPLDTVSSKLTASFVADTLVKVSQGSSGEPFWFSGATNCLQILIVTMFEYSKKIENRQYMNLNNLLQLVLSWGTEPLDNFIMKYADNQTFKVYEALKRQPSKIIGSFLSIAQDSLKFVSDSEEIAYLVSKSELSFIEMRKKPTLLYIIVQPEMVSYYSVLLQLFIKDFYRTLTAELPADDDLSIFSILDEMPALRKIDGLINTMLTCRKYRINVTILCQSLRSLYVEYGRDLSSVLLEGACASKYWLSADSDSSFELQKILGITSVETEDGHMREKSLMSAHMLRLLKGQGIFLQNGMLPAFIDNLLPYDKNPKLIALTKTPYILPERITGEMKIDYINLEDLT